MSTNGLGTTAMLWGEPRYRPHKGFLVRWFEWLNSTWPHPQHRLVNSARDANSMATMVPCLFSHLPPSFDLLFIEGGSMFNTNTPALMEAVARQVVSMRSLPTVAFVTVHCNHAQHRTRDLSHSSRRPRSHRTARVREQIGAPTAAPL